MFWIFWFLIALCGIAIAYQDFKTRLISLWLIVLYAILNISCFLYFNSVAAFMENLIFCFLYLLFSFVVLVAYLYFRKKKIRYLKDNFGSGDSLILVAVGICLEPLHLIPFFTIAFVSTLLIHLLVFKRRTTIPLAGFVSLLYPLYILAREFYLPGLF